MPDAAEWYAARGLSMDPLPDGPTGDYRIKQGQHPDELRAELDTPRRCRQWVRDCYEHRLWASPGSFDQADLDFMDEPFADIERLAAAWAPYQLGHGRAMTEPPKLMQRTETPTLILYGPDDQVVPKDFPKRCEIAFPNRTGPLVVPESGHFLQWERADVLNAVASFYFADLRGPRQA